MGSDPIIYRRRGKEQLPPLRGARGWVGEGAMIIVGATIGGETRVSASTLAARRTVAQCNG